MSQPDIPTKKEIPHTLTIAGSDSGGGAGIQQDIRVFSTLGLFSSSVITALTAQNSLGVQAVQEVSPNFVRMQLEAVMNDITPKFIKTGMLVNAAIVREIASVLSTFQGITLIIDTVMISKNGKRLIDLQGVEEMKSRLFPISTLITPNIPEAEALTGMTITTEEEMELAAHKIYLLSEERASVLIKGGHLEGDKTTDCLLHNGETRFFRGSRIETRHTHGTGCALSSAITGLMAHGARLTEACALAVELVRLAIFNARPMGKGTGVLDILSWKNSKILKDLT